MLFFEAMVIVKNANRHNIYTFQQKMDDILEVHLRRLANEYKFIPCLRNRTLSDNYILKFSSPKIVAIEELTNILNTLNLDEEIVICSVYEITFTTFCRHPSRRMNAELQLLDDVFNIKGAINLDDSFYSMQQSTNHEFICAHVDKNSYIFQSIALKEELQRIRNYACNEFQPGNIPVHYALQAGNEAALFNNLSVLVGALYDANRINSRRVLIINTELVRINNDKIGNEIYCWLEPLCALSTSGVILVKLPYIKYGFCQKAKSEYESRKTRFVSIVHRLFEIYKNKVQFVFSFESCDNEDNIKCGLTETFPHDVFVTLVIEGITENFAKDFLITEAKKNFVEIDDTLIKTLPKKAEYSEAELCVHFNEWVRQKLIFSRFPEYEIMRPVVDNQLQPKSSALRRLNNLIGLSETKKQIKQIIANIELQKRRLAAGLNNQAPCLNMLFMGNPGTGKTTVARIIGEIFAEKNIIPCGKYFEISLNSIKGDVSWHDILKQTRKNVLFLDEAYTLNSATIDQLVPYLENCRDSIVVFAGYKDEMKAFLNKNIGLFSRIPYRIDFPDYNPSELIKITDLILIEKSYIVSKNTREMLFNEFCRLRFLSGNARDVRVMVEKAILEAAERLSQYDIDVLSTEELQTLEMSDFLPILHSLRKERRNKTVTNFLGSPLLTASATHAVKFAGRAVSSKLSGERITKKETIDLAISLGTELVMNYLKKQNKHNKTPQ